MSEIRRNIFLEDGRRAEKRIVENPIDDCASEIVTETYEEKPLPKYLTQRIIETKKPMVVQRETHILGEDGQTVVETRKESLEPDYKLCVREVVQTPPTPTVDAPTVQDTVKQAVAEALNERDAAKKGIRGENPSRSARYALGEVVENPKKLTIWDLTGIAIILAQAGAVIYFVAFF